MTRRNMLIGLVAIAFVVAAATAFALRGGGDVVFTGLDGDMPRAAVPVAEGSAVESTGAAKAVDGSAAEAPGAGGAAPSGADTTPGEKSPAGAPQKPSGTTPSSPAPGPGTEPGTKPVAETKFRIMWWDETSNKAPAGFEVVHGSTSLKPSGARSGTGLIGPSAVGVKQMLVVYPDGRSGKKFEVPFTLTPSMRPTTELDAIHVEVSDTKVRVVGNPVDNFDHEFNRF